MKKNDKTKRYTTGMLLVRIALVIPWVCCALLMWLNLTKNQYYKLMYFRPTVQIQSLFKLELIGIIATAVSVVVIMIADILQYRNRKKETKKKIPITLYLISSACALTAFIFAVLYLIKETVCQAMVMIPFACLAFLVFLVLILYAIGKKKEIKEETGQQKKLKADTIALAVAFGSIIGIAVFCVIPKTLYTQISYEADNRRQIIDGTDNLNFVYSDENILVKDKENVLCYIMNHTELNEKYMPFDMVLPLMAERTYATETSQVLTPITVGKWLQSEHWFSLSKDEQIHDLTTALNQYEIIKAFGMKEKYLSDVQIENLEDYRAQKTLSVDEFIQDLDKAYHDFLKDKETEKLIERANIWMDEIAKDPTFDDAVIGTELRLSEEMLEKPDEAFAGIVQIIEHGHPDKYLSEQKKIKEVR